MSYEARFQIHRVILYGGSMGGSSRFDIRRHAPEAIDGVVAMNGTANHVEYANFQDAISESFGGTKAEIPQEYKKRSAEFWPHIDDADCHHRRRQGHAGAARRAFCGWPRAQAARAERPAYLSRRRRARTNYQDATAAFDFVLREEDQADSQSAPVDIARFAQVMTWPPERTSGTAAARLQEFPAADVRLDVELKPEADGGYVAPAASDGRRCIGLHWPEMRFLRRLELRWGEMRTLPAAGDVQLQYWEGLSPWQGEWKPLHATLEPSAGAWSCAHRRQGPADGHGPRPMDLSGIRRTHRGK